MASRRLSAKDYYAAFSADAMTENSKRAKALAVALDVRKFEIELYWKRAAYFWVFAGAAFAGHLASLTSSDAKTKPAAMLLTSCVGLVFAFAWYLVNRASKYWQTNWEAHVDLLEDDVQGPLYKTVLFDSEPWWKLNAAYQLSVSKINQMLSLFVVAVFALLIANTTRNYFRVSCSPELLPTSCLLLTAAALVSFVVFGKGSRADWQASARLRETSIE